MNSEFLIDQLAKLGINPEKYDVLQDKDGVTVARVFENDRSVILKCFEDEASRREMTNYRLLSELSVPTLNVLGMSDAAFVMEDIAVAGKYRLATEADMADVRVAKKLAEWYRKLHDSGKAYVAEHGAAIYSETGLFTFENIEYVMYKSGTQEKPVWRLIQDNYERIMAFINNTPMTLTYNDFYYTNMAVARDDSTAIMFDYNLLGKGHAFSDMRNVQYSLSKEAAAAFKEAYGEHDFRTEILIDDAVSPVVTLYMAYQRASFPGWAQESLKHVCGGYIGAIEQLLAHA